MNYYSGEFYLIVFHLVIGVIGIVWIGIDLLILNYKEKQKRKLERLENDRQKYIKFFILE